MPEVFYAMEFTDFMLMREGWNDKLEYEQAVVKKQTMLILSGLVGGKKVHPEKLWPLRGDNMKQVKMVKYRGMDMTESQMRQLVRSKEESIKKKQEKKKDG